MKVQPISNYYAQNNKYNRPHFKGQVKLRSEGLNVFDINLLKEKSAEIIEFAKKQKYNYVISKEFKMINVIMEENGREIDKWLVLGYEDKYGNRHVEKIFDTIKSMTENMKSKNL